MPQLHGATYGVRYSNLTEPLARYEEGGYHPVHLGDRFRYQRYEVVAKLGFGDSSTVWLARDHDKQRWVALKIKTADAGESSEDRILKHLTSEFNSQTPEPRVVKLLDTFLHSGPHGLHRCLVLELLGPHILRATQERSADVRLSVEQAAFVPKQVLQGLAFLHSNNVWHLDMKREKILVEVPHLQSMDRETILYHYGEPTRYNVTRQDGRPHHPAVPDYLLRATPLAVSEYESFTHVKLIGFDQAHHNVSASGRPRPFAASSLNINVRYTDLIIPPPESHTREYGAHTDVWLAGYVIYKLLTPPPPVPTNEPEPKWDPIDAHNMFGAWPARFHTHKPEEIVRSLRDEFVADFFITAPSPSITAATSSTATQTAVPSSTSTSSAGSPGAGGTQTRMRASTTSMAGIGGTMTTGESSVLAASAAMAEEPGRQRRGEWSRETVVKVGEVLMLMMRAEPKRRPTALEAGVGIEMALEGERGGGWD